MTRKFLLAVIIAIIGGLTVLHGEVRMCGVFGDNMVIQRNAPVKVWGWADRKEAVEVTFNGQTHKTRTDRNGNWQVTLSPTEAGGPYVLKVIGKDNSIEHKNILVGEVWLCSGQSNMEWLLSYLKEGQAEIAAADYPEIRSLNVKKNINWNPQSDIEGDWQVCSPETAGNFSAVAYYYARELYEELNTPIGIINSSWGGSDIESWTSAPSYEALHEDMKISYNPALITGLEQHLKKNGGKMEGFSESVQIDKGMTAELFSIPVDDSDWDRISVPQEWSSTPLADVDGIVWFRSEFDLPSTAKGLPAKVHLGRIDDADITWINGVQVGTTKDYTQNRTYDIPAGVLKEGRNVVAVRAEDEMGTGGFMALPDECFLEVSGAQPLKISLAGSWKYLPTAIGSDYYRSRIDQNSLYSLLYNGMIYPIIDFRIRGAIWYQGENNTFRSYSYSTLFPNMIEDWRARWGYEFPFYWVQLANYMGKDDVPMESMWAELRETQTQTLSLAQTGQAVIIDIGEAGDIHPQNKHDVGKRLAINALNKTYNKKNVIFSGPTYLSMEKQGSKLLISFDLHGSKWELRNKYGYIDGFAVAGADRRFSWAKATMEGDKIVVWCEDVKDPVAVRFAWSNNPDVNLFNTEGLPLVPFRTDDWPLSTQKPAMN